MRSCQSVWACDPRCQSPSGTAVSALTPQHAALTCPRTPSCPHRDGADATDKCISMSLLSRSIDQYRWCPDWNICQIYFSEVWFTWGKLRVYWLAGHKAAIDTVSHRSVAPKEKQANAFMRFEVRETKAQRITLSFHAWSFPYVPLEPPAHPSHFTHGKTAVWESSIFTVQQSIKLNQIQ